VSGPDLGLDTGPQAVGLLQLQEDPQYPRIPPERRAELVEYALDDGRSMADRIFEQWGRDPAAIAARCRVPVVRSEGDAGFGSVVVYAEYVARPCSITLYVPSIRRLDRLGAECDVPMSSSLPIFLAHELYHHFDCMRGKARLSRRHPVRIFSIGSWHWTAGLSSLSEIAAGAFAQQLLGLPFHPKILDSLLLEKERRRFYAGD
jgi:hypothetical protein